MFNKAIAIAAITASTVFITTTASAKQVLVIDKDIPYAATSNANDKVRAECQLGLKLSKFIRAYSKKSKFDVKNESSSSSDYILTVEIGDVFAAAGGAFSGPKSVRVIGSLSQNGSELGNFEGRRYSTGGAFAAFKGTCSILGRDVKALGKDISRWLKNPAKNSKLGDLK